MSGQRLEDDDHGREGCIDAYLMRAQPSVVKVSLGRDWQSVWTYQRSGPLVESFLDKEKVQRNGSRER